MCLAISLLQCVAARVHSERTNTCDTMVARAALFLLFYTPQQILLKGENAFVGGWVVAGVG